MPVGYNTTKITFITLRANFIFKFFILLIVFLLHAAGMFAIPADMHSVGRQLEVASSVSLQDTTEVTSDTIPDSEDERITGSATILDARVDYSAEDTIFHDLRNRKVYIYGNGELTYENTHLVADYIEIDFHNNELYATGLPDSLGVMQGLPVFTEDMQSFQSEELRYNFETGSGRTLGVITEEAEGYVHGDVVKIQPTREVHVADGKYTTCDDPDPHFHIEFRRAKIIPDDKIVSSLAYLVIEGVPTPLFVPFGFFPNTRGQASGILIPSYGESRERGFYLENGGFYWGINDYVDLSIRGDIYSRGSWALRTGSNYSVRYRYSGSVNLSYAINVLGERNLPGYERNRDFRIRWNHNQAREAHPSRTFRASVNAGSRQASRFNPRSDQDYLSNTFSSNISYSRNWDGRYNLSANLRHSQNTNTGRVDLSLPELTFSVSRFNPFERSSGGQRRWYEDINMNYNMRARNELSITDSLLFTSAALENFRNGVRHDIPVSFSTRVLNHFNFNTRINYNERWYFNTIRKEWDQDAVRIVGNDTIYGDVREREVSGFEAIRDFSLSAGLSTRLYGIMQFESGMISAVRHVLSPSIGFSLRPDFADPFWGYYREYYDPYRDEDVQYAIFEGALFGGPPAGRSGNISFSLTNNLEMKLRDRNDPDGEERKLVLIDNFSLSGGYDLARDSLNFSDLRLSGRTRLLGNFDITYSSSWTPYMLDDDGRRINRFLISGQNKLLQLNNTRWTLNLNYTFSSDAKPTDEGGNEGMQEGMAPDRGGNGLQPGEGLREGQGEDIMEGPAVNGVDYAVPWNVTMSYSFNYNSRYMNAQDNMDREYVQNLSLRGDVYLTPKWRIGFRTGYDFENHELTYTSIDVYRDLHCWEMTFNWIPMGFRQSYNFTIRVKASMLQDLKLTRRAHHLDRTPR